jgi:hypothetical protein
MHPNTVPYAGSDLKSTAISPGLCTENRMISIVWVVCLRRVAGAEEIRKGSVRSNLSSFYERFQEQGRASFIAALSIPYTDFKYTVTCSHPR